MNSFYSRSELEKIGFAAIGDDVQISKKASIYNAGKMTFGNHIRIDDFCILSGKITVGDHVHIAAFSGIFAGDDGVEFENYSAASGKVILYASSDDYSGEYFFNPTFPDKYRKLDHGKIVLRKFALIGAGSIVLPNVVLGEGASVGAMSLICKNLKPWTIYAGIPCRELKPRSKRLLELEIMLLKEEALKKTQS